MVTEAYFRIDGQDVIMFESRGSAEAFLEAYDVGPGRDSIFRSDGTALRLEKFDRRVVVTDDVAAHDPSGLAEALRRFLLEVPRRRSLRPEQIRTASLPELVEEFSRTEKAW
jgi:hypothetical protein